MKKYSALLPVLLLALCLCACGKKEPSQEETLFPSPTVAPIIEVKITPENLYDYFEYWEFRSDTKREEGETAGEISSVQIAYGLRLKDGFTAANSPDHKDSLTLCFTAEGVIKSGSFDIDFSTLQYTGIESSVETRTISETLHFWPQGNRTTTWVFGNYSDSYIMYLQGFTVTSVEGSIFLQTG